MAFSKSLQKGQTALLCQMCEESSEIKWKCMTCESLMCTKCCKIHRKFKSSEKHDIVDLKDIAQSGTTLDFANITCSQHKDKKCCLYCKACEELVCPMCIAEVHNTHKMVKISEGYEVSLRKVKDMNSEVEGDILKFTSDVSKLDSIRTAQRSHYMAEKEKILHHEKAVKAAIEKHTKKLLDDLDQRWKNLESSLKDEEMHAVKMTKDFETENKALTQAITSNNAYDVFKIASDGSKARMSSRKPVNTKCQLLPRFVPAEINPLSVESIYGSLEAKSEPRKGTVREPEKPSPTGSSQLIKYEKELYKKARGILNKLTPQKFQTLVKQMSELQINSEEHLKGVANLVFEKAIAEPVYSVAYASMCRYLTQIKVPSTKKQGEFVNFRAVLLTRCQTEFEKDKDAEDEIEKLRVKLKEETDESKKPQMREEIEVAKINNRRRSLGNIRFTGELFKLKMLTEPIMHQCVFKLLNSKDEESLECLCKLLRTIGKELDTEKAKPRVDQYFHRMKKVVDEKKTSSRVRFMLQDVIELRLSNWVPRRDENNPKTIEQIHKEAQQEQQEKILLLQTVNIQPQKPMRGGGRGGSILGQSGSMGGGSTPDGWNTVGGRPSMRGERQTIDPARLKLSKQNVDDNIQLGPGGGAGRFSGWQRGSSGGGAKTASREAEKTPGNRFQALSKPEDEGRSRYGVSPARDGGRGRGFGRPKGITPRSSQEQEKERAVAAARSIAGGQTTPREGPSRESSRGREPREGTFKEPEKPAPTAGSQLTEDEMVKKTHAILDEYLHIQDIKEAITCVEEVNSSPFIHVFVSECLNQVLERSAVARRHTGLLLHDLVKKSIITDKQYLQGLNSVLSYAEDMEIDIPKIWQYFGELIGPMVQDGSVPLSFLKEACQPLKESGKAGILVAEILHDASDREGHKKVGDLWRKSGLEWSDFVAEDKIEQFLKDKKLEFTVTDGSQPTTPTVRMPLERIQAHLQDLVVEKQKRNEEIFDWIEANLDDITTKDKKFIRALMTAVCSSAITGRGNSAKVDPTGITLRGVILQKYLDYQADFELQALYALQALVHKLEHPPGVLRTLFDTLYDEDIISEDAFNQWESSKDPAEQEGKGVAMKQVVQFFTWLREADDEVDS